ncbi:LPS-assembly lipoprotein LptE [Marinomonas epiphytica]
MSAFFAPFRFATILMLMLGLSACGFHLRGLVNMPANLQTLTLDSQSGSTSFDRELRIALKRADVTIVDKLNALPSTRELKVNAITTQDTVLARNTDNEITQIERRLNLVYFIRNETGKALYGPRTVSTSQVLANQNAEESTKAAYNAQQTDRMNEDLATQLLSDLSYAPL